MHDPLLRRVRDVPHPLQDQPGAIGEVVNHGPVCDPGENQHRVQAAFNARHDVRVHPVPNDDGVLGVPPQEVDARPHHQRIGLADVVGLLPRGQLNGGHQGPTGGHDALLGGAGQVAVGANEPGA